MYKQISLLALLAQITSQEPIVQLPNGQILGREDITSEGVQYYAFEKIPFAAPPVGDLRFKSPQPPENWDGVLNTTTLDVMCIQIGGSGPVPGVSASEDCLYLNVFLPTISLNSSEPLAVMAYIFGGAYRVGTAAEYKADLFMNHGVILVAMNYRVGPFGFISTQDEVIPGNNGLKDQLLALQWINNNIALFGGDPNKVTIFGQSAGGGSCAYHLLNQNSLGLFQGAILESGTFLSPGMYQRDSRNIAFGVGAAIDPSFETNQDSEALLQLLLNSTADEIKAAVEQYSNKVSQPWEGFVDQGSMWAPVIEVKNPDAIVTRKMYGLLSAGNILPIPTMMGFTSEESLLGKDDPEMVKSVAISIDADLSVIVPNDMEIMDNEERGQEGTLIREIYTDGEPFEDHLGALIRYSSDNTLTRAMIKHAELFSSIAPTFFYQFSYDGIIGGIDAHYDGADNVGHTEELKYLFCGGSDCTDTTKYPEDDLLTRERLITIWTNFAKYQNPTPEPQSILQNVTWPQLKTDEGDFFYLDINSDLEVQNHPKQKYYEGWATLYGALDYTDFDTF
ncbi:juvenile hormone esterase-like [Zophobas morio]|uniref:juvenile hormone esterase-like n=1 Tax=Zophobas morio TaxID=2755281 RepID=UPI00308328C8